MSLKVAEFVVGIPEADMTVSILPEAIITIS